MACFSDADEDDSSNDGKNENDFRHQNKENLRATSRRPSLCRDAEAGMQENGSPAKKSVDKAALKTAPKSVQKSRPSSAPLSVRKKKEDRPPAGKMRKKPKTELHDAFSIEVMKCFSHENEKKEATELFRSKELQRHHKAMEDLAIREQNFKEQQSAFDFKVKRLEQYHQLKGKFESEFIEAVFPEMKVFIDAENIIKNSNHGTA